MQGRQEPEGKRKDPLDRSATSGYRFSEEAAKYRRTDGTGAYRFSDLTGRQPVVPKRPPGMSPHLDGPPPKPRVARPQPEKPKRKSLRWWTGALVVFLVGGILLLAVAYGAVNFFFAANSTLGPATAAGDFLSALQTADYDQAYAKLDPTITVQLSSSDFKKMAQADDHCYGQVTDYQEVNGSGTVSADQNTQSFTYTITRSKLPKTYQMILTLQKDGSGSWDVSNYGDDLGPAAPTCS
ncbi:MAG TPA: hypothetical protein VF458_20640 [Ktedonobacteraceae bacterium]